MKTVVEGSKHKVRRVCLWFRYFEFESRAQSKYDTTSLPVLQVVIAIGSIPLPNFLGFYLLTVGAARLLSLFIADAARDWLEDDGWWQSGSESLSEDISSTSSTRVSRMLIWPTGVRSPVKGHRICSIKIRKLKGVDREQCIMWLLFCYANIDSRHCIAKIILLPLLSNTVRVNTEQDLDL